VPFLVDRLRLEADDDLAVLDILLVFAKMARSRIYDVKSDSSLMNTLASRVAKMKDKELQAICLQELEDLRTSELLSPARAKILKITPGP
jgi:hypothetical protein